MADSLHVVLVVEAADGGAGRHIIDLASEMIAQGHRVRLVYSPVRASSWFVEAASSIGGLSIYQIKMLRSPGLQDLWAGLRLRRLLCSFGKIDIIHGHSSKAGALVRIAARGLGSKIIYTPHAFVTMNPTLVYWRRWIFSSLERFLSRFGDTVICVSEDEHSHAKHLNLTMTQCSVVKNGIVPLETVDRVAIRSSWGIGPEAICAGSVGRISYQKGVDILIETFARVYNEQPLLHLIIVGTGVELDGTKTLANQLGVADRVVFTGFADGSALMAGFDFYVSTSRFEAFSYSYLEAAGRGLPIVATRVGGIDAVVTDGVNGYVVEQGRIDLFSERISELCSAEGLRNRMSEASLEIAKQFTATTMVEETVGVYARLLEEQRT